MEEDIRKWVLQCPQSQSKRAFIKEKVEYTPIEVTEPLELVGMDPVGKLTVPEQTGGGSAQTVGPTPPRDDVCSENENPADHKVQPLFSDVWEGGEVPITEEKVSSSVQMEEVFEGLKKQEAVFAQRGSLLNYKKVLDPSPLAGPLPSTSTTDCQARGASSDVETLIRDIWAGRRKETLWAKYGPYKVYSENLLVLAPGKELEREIMDNLFGRCGVGSAPPGTLASTPLFPTASQPSTTLPCASEAQPGPSTTLPCASEAQPGPSMTLPTTLPCASEAQPGPSMTLPTTQPRSIRSRVSHPSFYDLYEAHSERRTSALETLVRPEQERRRRLKERNRRRFEAKMLTAMGEVVSQLKSIGSQQERIIELLQDKPNMP
ncbi:hypothetical protein KUCAC02_009628 [Chaenocephalus aceratus]|nr:hypothetical protein KUCAC02_009628 [Chaenocephalus aceratus]